MATAPIRPSASLRFLFCVVLAASLAPLVSLWADQTLSDGGLEITVKEQRKEIPDFGAFSIEVKNTTPEPRTLTGKLVLSADSGDVGTCTLYVAVQPNQTASKVVQCKGIGYKTWKAVVVKIYPFIVED